MITPFESYPKLAKAMGLPHVFFKREDLHPYGSHKGRSIPVMIDSYYAAGDRRFALSSSGNAALAAALHAKHINVGAKDPADMISLDIFVGRHVASHKLERLKSLADAQIRVLVKERPLQALSEAMNEGMRSLRQSTDDAALKGYGSLAEEFAESSKKDKIGAVFIGTSSGTTAQALASYFISKNIPIQVHIVQTSSCHPMSDAFGAYEGPEEMSDADAIVDITALRKKALIPLIEKTGGYGWFAGNDAIQTAIELTAKNAGLDISTNSALSVAGAIQAAYAGYEIEGAVVCMICGE